MCPSSDRPTPALLVTCLLAAHAAFAQPAPTAPPPQPAQPAADPILSERERTETVENYAGELELTEVLAAHLRQRVASLPPEQRREPAELLARLYVRMLSEAPTADRRRELEALAQDLLRRAPEADNAELRIDLAKAGYLRAEQAAELVRVRLASDDDAREAVRTLRECVATFAEVRATSERRVADLERGERRQQADDPVLAEQLSAARRVRSLAAYYEGWTRYYLAFLTQDKGEAETALRAFGVLLNAVPGSPASIERLPRNNLRLEHVARAVVGTALSTALLGDDVSAMRWLEQLSLAEELSAEVEQQLAPRRITILAGAGRWADVDVVASRAIPGLREGVRVGETVGTLRDTATARLVVVLAMEALAGDTLRGSQRTIAEGLASRGLAELVRRGELQQVIDLVTRYGADRLGGEGGEGFLVAYVRGLRDYDAARAAHRETDEDDSRPTRTPRVAALYRSAASLVQTALDKQDAVLFADERPRALLRLGLARYHAGDTLASIEVFERAFAESPDDRLREDALWFAVVAAEELLRAQPAGSPGAPSDARATRDRLSQLFLRTFPASPNSVRIALQQAEGLSDDEALSLFLSVSPDDALYVPARRAAVRVLYRLFRAAPASTREAAALRLVDIADPLLCTEVQQARTLQDAAARDAGEQAVIRARQIAEALLSSPAPDVARIESVLSVIDEMFFRFSMDPAPLRAELLFRKIQLDLARGDVAGATTRAEELRTEGGPFSLAAERLLLARAVEAASGGDVTSARAVVRAGLRVLADAQRLGDRPLASSVREQVASAAALLWRREQDRAMLALALETDAAQIAAGSPTRASLRRIAELAEADQQPDVALDAWLRLMNATDAGSVDWTHARYESLRILTQTDPPAAVKALDQHLALFPSGGAAPWGKRILLLSTPQLRDAAAAQSPAPQPPTTSGGGG